MPSTTACALMSEILRCGATISPGDARWTALSELIRWGYVIREIGGRCWPTSRGLGLTN